MGEGREERGSQSPYGHELTATIKARGRGGKRGRGFTEFLCHELTASAKTGGNSVLWSHELSATAKVGRGGGGGRSVFACLSCMLQHGGGGGCWGSQCFSCHDRPPQQRRERGRGGITESVLQLMTTQTTNCLAQH